MENSRITVFTPTFNREEYLKKLYGSLTRQSDKRFVWLIVDDGSVDNTSKLIGSWKAEGKFPIKYIYQKNQGKHAAHNAGVMNAGTEYFYCVDSDDTLPEDAIASIYKAVADISARSDIAGLIAKKGYHTGEDMCTEFPDNVTETSIRDIYKVYKLKGELAMVFKTKVAKEFLFPIFGSEKFVGENAVLNLISMKYKMKLMNKVIYLAEYLPDGYSRNLSRIHKKNPMGYLYCLAQEIELARTSQELKHAYADYISGCWKVGYRVNLDYKNIIVNFPEATVLYMKMIIKESMLKSEFLRPIIKRLFKVKFL